MDQPSYQAALQPYLLEGERTIWTGQPDPSRLVSSGDWYLVPFSLMWGGFAIFWEASALGIFNSFKGGAPLLLALFGVPFVVIGQYLIWGRFFYKRWDRKRTIYAVTTQRILILRRSRLQALFVAQLPPITQSTRADGSGSLVFGMAPFGQWGNNGMEWFDRRQGPPAFYDIPEVMRVYRLIADTQRPPIPE